MEIIVSDKKIDLIVKDDNLYSSSIDLSKLLNDKDSKKFLKRVSLLEKRKVLNNSNTISLNNIKYYNINYLLEELNDFIDASNFIDTLKVNGLDKYLCEYVLDNIKNKKDKDDISYLDDYLPYFETINKMRNKNVVSNDSCYFEYKDEEYYLDLLKRIKKRANNKIEDEDDLEFGWDYDDEDNTALPLNFGKLKDDVSLELILNESRIDLLDITLSLLSANMFYTIIKEEPFEVMNEEIAGILALDVLNSRGKLEKKLDKDDYYDEKEKYIVSSSDLICAYNLVKQNINKEKVEVIKLIEPLFKDDSLELDLKENNIITKDSSLNDIYNYIIDFSKHYVGYIGFYEFFSSNSNDIYKIHYHALYKDFKLNLEKTLQKDNTFVFDVIALGYTEAPNDLKNRDKVIEDIFTDLKIRSYEFIKKDYMSKLIEKIGKYLKINIEFDLKWNFEVDLNYDF